MRKLTRVMKTTKNRSVSTSTKITGYIKHQTLKKAYGMASDNSLSLTANVKQSTPQTPHAAARMARRWWSEMKCEEEASCESNIRQASCKLFQSTRTRAMWGEQRQQCCLILLAAHWLPTGTHVNALCNEPRTRHEQLENVKATTRRGSMHEKPSFALPH